MMVPNLDEYDGPRFRPVGAGVVSDYILGGVGRPLSVLPGRDLAWAVRDLIGAGFN